MSGDRYQIREQNSIHYLTFTVVDWIDVFTRIDYKQSIVQSLNYCIEHKGLEVYAWVLMTNHMHLIAKAKSNYRLSEIIRDFKKFTPTSSAFATQYCPNFHSARRSLLVQLGVGFAYVINNRRSYKLCLNLSILGNEMIMNRYKETFETWNKIASLYQDKFMDLNLYNDTYDFICSSIEKDKAKVLEIGCGPGNITKYLLSKRPDFDIYGIDIAPNMVELAKKNNPSASFAIMDSRQIDEINTKFDGIVCGFCLPYLSQRDTQKLIKDCYNLLNENGLIYLSFVEGDPIKSNFQVGSSGDRMYFYFHSLEELTEQLLKNNFEQINVFKVNYQKKENEMEIHTILTANKKTTRR